MARKSGKGTKRANSVSEYTEQQIKELARCAKDPVYFIRHYIRIQHPVRGAIPFDLYPYQEEMIRNFQNRLYNICLLSRQTGKSCTTGAFLLWYASFNFDKTILIASNKNENAMEMISRIQYMYINLPDWLKPGVRDDEWNKHALGFDQGSRIISSATSENAGRGLSISLLFCDEMAFVPPAIQQKFWTSILPTLSTGGSSIIASTPNGDSDLFAQLWRSAEVGKSAAEEDGISTLVFHPFHVPWYTPPGRDEKFKKQQIALIGEQKWSQEFECAFLSSEQLLISSLYLSQITPSIGKPKAIINDYEFYEEIYPRNTYLVGVDPSSGTGKDFSVITLYSFPALVQVAEFRSNTMSSPELYLKLKWLLSHLEKLKCTVYFSIENNGVGEGLISLYQNDDKPNETSKLISEEGKNRMGITSTPKTKLKACLDFKLMLESGNIRINSLILLKELKTLIRREGGYRAQNGSTDDAFHATLLVVRILQEISLYEEAAYAKLFGVTQTSLSTQEDLTNFKDDADQNTDENEEPMPYIIGSRDDIF